MHQSDALAACTEKAVHSHSETKSTMTPVTKKNEEPIEIASGTDRFKQVHESLEILNELSTAIVVCDDRMRILYINPSAQSLLDISAKNANGESVVGYFVDTETQLLLRKCLNMTQPATMRQTELRDAGHRTKLVDCIVTPALIEGAENLILEINVVNTEMRKLLDNTMVRGQTANVAVIRGIAHEIKNPLGGLRGAAQLLDRELKDEPELKEYTRIIIQETDRLCNLVDDMSGPQTPLRIARTNVHQVLEHVRKLALAEQPKDFRIELDYDPSLPEVLGDPEQLIQAVLNIVRNSIAATDETGVITFRTRVQRQVTLANVRYRSAARIEIEDNGSGIPEDILDHVFYPMISGNSQGEGLGLSIVHQIIARHGGVINCESNPGRTCFTILLKFADQLGVAEFGVGK